MIDIDTAIENAPKAYQIALWIERQSSQRILETPRAVLAEVGVETKNREIISILEDTGLAGYDASVGRIYLLPELVEQSLSSAAQTYSGDE